jgi:hypothetical protein
MISTNYRIVIGIIICIIIIFLLYNTSENFTTTSPLLATEACQNVASVYADTKGTAKFNNIHVAGTITIGEGANKWILNPIIVDGSNNQLSITPLNSSGVADITNQFTLYHDKPEIYTNKRIDVDGNINIRKNINIGNGTNKWSMEPMSFNNGAINQLSIIPKDGGSGDFTLYHATCDAHVSGKLNIGPSYNNWTLQPMTFDNGNINQLSFFPHVGGGDFTLSRGKDGVSYR